MLEVNKNNIYSTGRLIEFESGESLLLRKKLSIELFTDDQYDFYEVNTGDRLPDIAAFEYEGKVKDPSKYWWVIADVNNIHRPFDISDLEGKSIIIPHIQDVKLAVSQTNEL